MNTRTNSQHTFLTYRANRYKENSNLDTRTSLKHTIETFCANSYKRVNPDYLEDDLKKKIKMLYDYAVPLHTCKNYLAGETIARAGERIKNIHFIVQGSALLMRVSDNGEEFFCGMTASAYGGGVNAILQDKIEEKSVLPHYEYTLIAGSDDTKVCSIPVKLAYREDTGPLLLHSAFNKEILTADITANLIDDWDRLKKLVNIIMVLDPRHNDTIYLTRKQLAKLAGISDQSLNGLLRKKVRDGDIEILPNDIHDREGFRFNFTAVP